MYKELESLIALISSWEDDNLKLAEQILEGNLSLKVDLDGYFKPLTKEIRSWQIDDWLSLEELPNRFSTEYNWQVEVENISVFEAFFQNMPITYLDISYLELKNFPQWILMLKNLEHLDLSKNQIKDIPKSISNLAKLEELNMEDNQIEVLPEEIGQLKNLERLVLDYNEIKELPQSIGELSSLEWLCLERNKIKALPKSCLKLQNLEWLSIEGTPLGNEQEVDDGIFIQVDDEKFMKFIK